MKKQAETEASAARASCERKQEQRKNGGFETEQGEKSSEQDQYQTITGDKQARKSQFGVGGGGSCMVSMTNAYRPEYPFHSHSSAEGSVCARVGPSTW